MTVLYPPCTMRPTAAVTTSAASGSLTAADTSGWFDVDVQLAEWLADPQAAVDYDAVAPSLTSIRLARSMAASLRYVGWDPPVAVVPDNYGGLAFEWRSGEISRSLAFYRRGDIEEITIINGRMQSRRAVEL